MNDTYSPPEFEPVRALSLLRLADFVPRAGRLYASNRNTDFGPKERQNVSMLSPSIRHRLITEREVLASVLAHHSFSDSEKFITEIFWRSYFKGYLEAHPLIWRKYRIAMDEQIVALQTDEGLARRYMQAIAGNTEIDCFNLWVKELVETGYLHNHARMWFASIWIFTLKLPWELGADFTFRHFIDGDPASNTLSWRWVGGLHTKGKTYLARADNIREYTNGRFDPEGLALHAVALNEPLSIPVQSIPRIATKAPSGSAIFLLTEDDLNPESLDCAHADIRGIIGLPAIRNRSTLATSGNVLAFIDAALSDGLGRASLHFGVKAEMIDTLSEEKLIACARSHEVKRIIMPYAPVGPLRDQLSEIEPSLARQGIELVSIGRTEDQLIWPHAMKGFFALRERIPDLIKTLGF